MSVTELTSQLDRSELKEEASQNTARKKTGESERTRPSKPKGRLGGGTHSESCW